MPSRNAVNNPRKTAVKPGRRPSKGIKLNSSENPHLTTKNAGKVTTNAISKKRAKKDQRNAKYFEQYLKSKQEAEDEDNLMGDTLSATQQKIKAKRQQVEQANAIDLRLEADLPAEEMQLSSSGKGTTLGSPPS